jgi:hypothetical protein
MPAGQSGDIVRIYYRYGDTGEDLGNTLGDLRIRMGQTNATGFQSGNIFFTGLEMVLHEETYTIAPGVEGDWFSIDLTTPFTYDPTKTLIIDIMFATTTTLNFGTLGTENDGRKLRQVDTTSTIGSDFPSTTWQDMGFDLMTSTGVVSVGTDADPSIFPNPFKDSFDLILEDGDVHDVAIFDPSGRKVLSLRIPANSTRTTIDLAACAPGCYLVQVVTANGVQSWRVLKE